MARPYGVGLYGRHRYSTGTYLLTQAFGAGTAIGTAAAQAEYTLAAMTEGVATGGYSLTVLIGTAAAWGGASTDGQAASGLTFTVGAEEIGLTSSTEAASQLVLRPGALAEISIGGWAVLRLLWDPQSPDGVSWDLQAAQEPAWGAQAVDEVSWDDRTADSASWAPQQPENVEWD